MLVTRLGYLAIVAILATAGVLVLMALQPDEAEQHPPMTIQQVIDYSRLGLVERIDVRSRTVIVHLKQDFDTFEAFGTDAHTFEAALPDGRSIIAILEEEGITVGGETGPRVTSQ